MTPHPLPTARANSACIVPLAWGLLMVVAVCAQAGSPSVRTTETVRIAASDRYERGRVHRFTFGGGYRALWKVPIELPVLDLDHEAGGLVPLARLGGMQTAVLALKGRDGRDYTFRSTDKDPSAMLHPDLHETFVESIVQDQMAAQHPGAPLVASHITTAAGILTPYEHFVVMPDHPALGEFRDEFAGMIGNFYEYPQPRSDDNPGFHGATEIIDHVEIYDRLVADPDERVDTDQFLRARLVDLLIGDFDRHRKQWRWAHIPGTPLWQPIPEDRDMAFVRYEGAAIRVAQLYVPILLRYGPSYKYIHGLTLHGWEQDRWLLTGLEWADWERVAKDLQARITDEVIDAAVATQPPEYQTLDGARLTADLRGRRDTLVEGARRFYDHLAGEVDVRATDAAESVRATHEKNGDLTIEVSVRSEEDGTERVAFARRLLRDETREVRVYLEGGADRVVVTGKRGPILLRLIAGGGAGELDDQAGGTRLYDSAGTYRVLRGPRTRVDTRPYEPPDSTEASWLDSDEIPPRDWGSDWYPLPQIGYEEDAGLFLGAGVVWEAFGFRKHPWSMRHALSAGWAFQAEKPRLAYDGTFARANSDLLGRLDVHYSGIETLGFFGFGNETDDDGSDSFFRVRNEELFVHPALEFPLWMDELRLSVGPAMYYSRTQDGSRLIDLVSPYGSGRFGMVGGLTHLRFDTRRSNSDEPSPLALSLTNDENPAAGYPTRGVFVRVRGLVAPEVWDVEGTWGSVRGSVAGYASVGDDDRFTLAIRGGGEHVFGTFPYTGGAALGGGGSFTDEGTIRGYLQQRFLGDQMVFGNLDLRVFLFRAKLFVPSDFGVLGFGDAGRVFFEDEDSDKWHTSAGGGIWFAPLVRTNAFSVTIANSTEETLVYFRSGFHF